MLKTKFVRVNFTNRGLAKSIKHPKNVTDDTPNKQNVLNIADILSDVKVTRGEPLKFNSIPEFNGIDYIGYIIDKERLDKNTGEWIRTDEYRIVGSEANSFVDTRVAYGQSYRYRIRSVLKVTKAETKLSLAHLESLQDIKEYESRKLAEQLEKKLPVLSEIEKITNLGLSPKTSSGQAKTTIRLSDDLEFQADDSSTELVSDPQNKNVDRRLLKNLRLLDRAITTGKISASQLQKLINEGLHRFVEQKVTYKSAYYESNPTKNWIYVDIVENEPPPPPQAIKITPCTPKNEIVISWLKPANSQRDVQNFRIYRREKLGDPWKVLGTLTEFDTDGDGFVDPKFLSSVNLTANHNVFIDRDVKVGKKYIYALMSIDVHGISSFLSTQIQAELNPNYELEKEEKPLKWISGSGAKPDETNFVVKRFFNRTEQIIAKQNIYLAPTTKFAEAKKDLIIKIKSLDTHETQEIKVTLRNSNIKKTP